MTNKKSAAFSGTILLVKLLKYASSQLSRARVFGEAAAVGKTRGDGLLCLRGVWLNTSSSSLDTDGEGAAGRFIVGSSRIRSGSSTH